jgi:malonate-semialdehyde dehydrogenase (acetylating)/methylmalonate-semialdehyde dehydrogenase
LISGCSNQPVRCFVLREKTATAMTTTTSTATAVDDRINGTTGGGGGGIAELFGGGGNSNEGDITIVNNYINGETVPPRGREYLDVRDPSTSAVIGRVALSSAADVDDAVRAAHSAFPSWSSMTTKARAALMLNFHSLVKSHARELASIIVRENGKNLTEALADVAKGNETVEYACSLPQLARGGIDLVSTDVSCRDRRDPLGVVASIVPFNFPFMVPHWTLPIALVCGNTIVLKPSEKVPLTMHRVAALFGAAGFPKGVVNLVNGTRDAVEGLVDHPLVRAVTFVGSSPVAKSVSDRCRALDKRCTALGGAKNHLVALPDCDVETTAGDVVVSFAGCAGQRCMAASVLLIVGDDDSDGGGGPPLLRRVIEKASEILRGTGPGEMGPVIDAQSLSKIAGYIEQSENEGAEILLDGRTWTTPSSGGGGGGDDGGGGGGGNWIGPTIILHRDGSDRAMNEEVFGPVLSVRRVGSWQEAIDVENSNPYGNAAAIYTTNGGHAEWFVRRFRASVSQNHRFPFRRFRSPLERVASSSLSIRANIPRACERVRLDAPP